jgi:hypothetical protein
MKSEEPITESGVCLSMPRAASVIFADSSRPVIIAPTVADVATARPARAGCVTNYGPVVAGSCRLPVSHKCIVHVFGKFNPRPEGVSSPFAII